MPQYLRQGMLIMVAGVGVFLVIVLAFIMPSQRAMAKLNAEIGVTKFKIETQEKLSPLYKNLTDKLGRIDKNVALPAAKPIPRSQLTQFSATVTAMAQKSKLVVLSVYPDTGAAESGSAYYNASLRGNFTDLRNFLLEVGTLPYIEAVQEIKIQTTSGVREFNIKMKLMVA